MINFLSEAESLRPKLINIRRELHQNPEVGNNEFKTAELIEKFLSEIGINFKRVINTGIIAKLNGKLPGKNLALRSDIDALPINEENDVNFKSKNPGVMHACGHDVHMTSLLGAAMLLKNHVDELKGSVTFIFQPDEEGNGGAERMIKAGCLEDVNLIFGAHVSPELPAGHVGFKYGKFYAASEVYKINIFGKSCHIAKKSEGIDALLTGAELVQEILNMNNENVLISVGKFHSGTAVNIVPGLAELAGSIRVFGVENRKKICDELISRVNKTANKFNAKSEIILTEGYPGIINNDEMTKLAENSARELFGDDRVHVLENSTMMSEDFGSYLLRIPGSFYHFGAGCDLPLHSNKFLPVDDAFITAAALHAKIIFDANK